MTRFSRLRGLGRRPAPEAAEPSPEERRLLGSALFDHEWYALVLGRRLDRPAAVRHYLAGGWRRASPHPLVAPEWTADNLGLADDVEPLGAYLEQQAWEVPTHPLLDVAAYVVAQPAALAHPDGPVGHYLAEGAAAGARVNDWYVARDDQPRGLVDWLWEDARAWAARRDTALPVWTRQQVEERADAAPDPGAPSAGGTLSVVLVAEHGDERLRRSVDSLLAQTDADWQLVLVPVAHTTGLAAYAVPDDPRVVRAPEAATRWEARAAALELARGTHVAWLVEGDRWLPGRLAWLRTGLAQGHRWLHDVARDERPDARRRLAARPTTRDRLEAGLAPDVGTLLVERTLLDEVGGPDPSAGAGQCLDLALRLDRVARPGHVRRVGVLVERTGERDRFRLAPADRPAVDHDVLASRLDPVLNHRLLDWDELARREVDDRVVSVVVPTHHDWEMTRLAVQRVVAARADDPDVEVQVVVVDNGSPALTSAVLSSLAEAHEDVVVVRAARNHGFALGNNLGLAAARGATVVHLNNDTEVRPGWLGPLLRRLADPEVLAAQSLLVYPGGAVQSAGVVFPRGGGLPHVLLQGFPVEDAAGLDEERLHALTGAALAVRWEDEVALRGFDPVFRNGMEDVDLCLRLAAHRGGHAAVCPGSVVVHHESRSPGRFTSSVANRALLLERWDGALPEDDVAAWARRGYAVLGHEVRNAVSADQRLCVAEPVLVPRAWVPEQPVRAEVREGVPRLRWALKNPAPGGDEGDMWGDTHFAEVLADALRSLGQEVVVDRREELARRTGWTDDVVLLLRGVLVHTPKPDQVNLQWLISHPDLFQPSAQGGWDRIYVASASYADRLRARGLPAVPMLQATDPARFHPDAGEPGTGPPVLFVGNSRGLRRTMVGYALDAGLPLEVVGWDWEAMVPPEQLSGTFIANDRLAAAYRSAGVVLNDHWSDMAQEGFVSNRLFDAVACGARVVSDPVPGIEELFDDAVRVVGSPEELRALVTAPDLDAVFGSDDVRRRRAAAVAEQHSFRARAERLLEDAVAIRATRFPGLPGR